MTVMIADGTLCVCVATVWPELSRNAPLTTRAHPTSNTLVPSPGLASFTDISGQPSALVFSLAFHVPFAPAQTPLTPPQPFPVGIPPSPSQPPPQPTPLDLVVPVSLPAPPPQEVL